MTELQGNSTTLFGHNPEEGIVAVHQKDDQTMLRYIRTAKGVRAEEEPFFPFFYLSDRTLIEGFGRKHWVKKLDGVLFYQYLCVFEQWTDMWEAVRHVLERYNRAAIPRLETYADLTHLYLITDPVAQYLMQTGRTLFKGFPFGDLLRMQVDIETFTPSGYRFPNAARKSDRIILIAMSDSTGWSHVIDGRKLDEGKMLRQFVTLLTERDPDVIEGHNIFGFDFPYILTRAALHDVPMTLGRDGSPPRSFETRSAFADHPVEYTVTQIAGRHVIDTLLLLQSYDSQKRTLESYSLKSAAQHFGFAAPDRTLVAPDRISWTWENNPAELVKYALGDVQETASLASFLSPTTFYLTRMVPGNYGAVARMGSASKIEHLMVREYLRVKHSLPKASEGAQTTGGYTDVFVVGALGPIIHADVESLYPSIMIARDIRPASDPLGIFPGLLGELTAMRLKAKRSARAAKDPGEHSRLDAMQSSMKILINSFYGYLGYIRGIFNDHAKADEVTGTGQEILRQMIDYIRTSGGKVIEVDTDGIYFVPPEGIDSEPLEQEYITKLSNRLPKGITVALDGRYRRMLSYKKKNYALLGYDNRIRIKGSSLISRSIERFGRDYVRNCIERILEGDVEGLHRLYEECRRGIQEHGFDVTAFARTETLKDPIEVYQEGVASGRRNKSAAYEVAIASGKPLRPGDRISYYITGSGADVRSFEGGRSIDEWDPNFPDENVEFYLKRLDELSEKFAEFFNPADFRAIFSPEALFPFDPKGIVPLIRDILDRGSDEEDLTPRPGIWLDE